MKSSQINPLCYNQEEEIPSNAISMSGLEEEYIAEEDSNSMLEAVAPFEKKGSSKKNCQNKGKKSQIEPKKEALPEEARLRRAETSLACQSNGHVYNYCVSIADNQKKLEDRTYTLTKTKIDDQKTQVSVSTSDKLAINETKGKTCGKLSRNYTKAHGDKYPHFLNEQKLGTILHLPSDCLESLPLLNKLCLGIEGSKADIKDKHRNFQAALHLAIPCPIRRNNLYCKYMSELNEMRFREIAGPEDPNCKVLYEAKDRSQKHLGVYLIQLQNEYKFNFVYFELTKIGVQEASVIFETDYPGGAEKLYSLMKIKEVTCQKKKGIQQQPKSKPSAAIKNSKKLSQARAQVNSNPSKSNFQLSLDSNLPMKSSEESFFEDPPNSRFNSYHTEFDQDSLANFINANGPSDFDQLSAERNFHQAFFQQNAGNSWPTYETGVKVDWPLANQQDNSLNNPFCGLLGEEDRSKAQANYPGSRMSSQNLNTEDFLRRHRTNKNLRQKKTNQRDLSFEEEPKLYRDPSPKIGKNFHPKRTFKPSSPPQSLSREQDNDFSNFFSHSNFQPESFMEDDQNSLLFNNLFNTCHKDVSMMNGRNFDCARDFNQSIPSQRSSRIQGCDISDPFNNSSFLVSQDKSVLISQVNYPGSLMLLSKSLQSHGQENREDSRLKDKIIPPLNLPIQAAENIFGLHSMQNPGMIKNIDFKNSDNYRSNQLSAGPLPSTNQYALYKGLSIKNDQEMDIENHPDLIPSQQGYAGDQAEAFEFDSFQNLPTGIQQEDLEQIDQFLDPGHFLRQEADPEDRYFHTEFPRQDSLDDL